MKFLFLFGFVLLWVFSNGQNSKRCNILDAFLKSYEANERFELSDHKEKPIIIIDPSKIFENCKLKDVYKRRVEVKLDSALLSRTDQNIIIIYSLKEESGMYVLELHQKHSGSYGRVYLKQYADKWFVIKFLVGYV